MSKSPDAVYHVVVQCNGEKLERLIRAPSARRALRHFSQVECVIEKIPADRVELYTHRGLAVEVASEML